MGAGLDGDQSRGPTVRLPRPAWHYPLPGLLAMALFSLASCAEYGLLTRDAVTVGTRVLHGAQRWPLIALWAVVLVLTPTLPLKLALTSPLVIREQGIEYDRKRVRAVGYRPSLLWVLDWLVETGRWASEFGRWEHRIVRGKLTIHGPDGIVVIPVASRDRAEVESAIRRSGKWQD